MISRRKFLSSTAAISLAFPALRCTSLDTSATNVQSGSGSRFGPLLRDPEGIIALPEGFSYKIISRHGEKMSDGFFVPSKHDGMGTLSGPNGLTVLIRNHEVVRHRPEDGPFGHDLELLSQIDQSLLYDAGTGGVPPMGGTTTLLYDTKNKGLVSHHLSLAGTIQNCAGGVTPWGSWISCEEIVNEPGEGRAKEHGYNFEVLRERNLPGLDQAANALLTDLQRHGLLDETLVLINSDFGRTPNVNAKSGRDHWTHCYANLLFGGGIQSGAEYGASDQNAAYVTENPVHPRDVCATVFKAMGISENTMIYDRLQRPQPIAMGGRPIESILS